MTATKVRTVIRDSVLVLHPDDIDFPQTYGFSLYKGVLVVWDEDHDPRILDVIDEMDAHDREQLVAARETKGTVTFIWRSAVPFRFDGKDVEEPSGDSWSVNNEVLTS